MSTSSILVVCYIALIVHTARGNKNRWLMFVIFLLLVSNFTYFVYGFMYNTGERVRAQGGDSLSPAYYATMSWARGLYVACFNLSHYMIATKYNEIAKRVPTMLNGQQEAAPSRLSRVVFWALVVLNVGCGMTIGYCS